MDILVLEHHGWNAFGEDDDVMQTRRAFDGQPALTAQATQVKPPPHETIAPQHLQFVRMGSLSLAWRDAWLLAG
jgi:hypothetical protein